MRPATVTFVALLGIGAIVACVGDDPAPSQSSSTSSSGGGSSGSSGASSGTTSSGGSSSGAADAAPDECEAGAKDCVGNRPRTCVSGKWENGVTCTGDDVKYRCEGGECVGALSCQGLISANCGTNAAQCCKSPKVDGAMFTRDFSPSTTMTDNGAATVTSFRLDQFEVTVERFRNFVQAGFGTKAKAPANGSGAHPKIANSGWQAAFNASLTDDTTALVAALTSCNGRNPATYGDATQMDRNKLPANCMTWEEAFAFCIWDGGRLPTAAEMNLAALGGIERRRYPWGAGTFDNTRAFYCESSPGCLSVTAATFPPVGSKPLGAGRYGQLDLLGSMREYLLDYFTPIPASCTDCAQLDNSSTTNRGVYGNGWPDTADIYENGVLAANLSFRTSAGGFRCARDLDP